MKKFAAVLFIAAVAWGLGALWYRHELMPPDETVTQSTLIKIPKGTGVKQIATLLEHEGIIRSPWAFAWRAKALGADTALQAGSFLLKPSMSVDQVIEALKTGVAQEGVITIPEGFTVKDIDALLAEKHLIEPGELIDCAKRCDFSSFNFLPSVPHMAARGGKLEGYLFPDTYFVEADNFVPKFFLERLLGTFEKRVIDPHRQEIASSKRSLHELVTMASLIEEETRTQDERPVVAGILWKRLDANTGLGVDAAIRYIVEDQTGALTQSDLAVDSPYNLRKYRGLPPGPIATFSLGSFEAALVPKESPYWYYLHGRDGVIHYAVTNDEHNENKATYLR